MGLMLNRQDWVLAGLAPAQGGAHRPVQVQKLFFLIEKNVVEPLLHASYFSFVPWSYGPFDANVYRELENLAEAGDVVISNESSWRTYALTPQGQNKADLILSTLSPTVRDYIWKINQFVRSLSFTQLVSSVYKAYPDMKVNSVFNG